MTRLRALAGRTVGRIGVRGRPGGRARGSDEVRRPGAAPPDSRLLRRTRWRLLAWSAGSTLVVLVVLGAAIYAAVAESLTAASVARLRERAGLVDVRPMATYSEGPQVTVGVALDPAMPGLVVGGSASGTIAVVVPPDAQFVTSVTPGAAGGTGTPGSPLESGTAGAGWEAVSGVISVTDSTVTEGSGRSAFISVLEGRAAVAPDVVAAREGDTVIREATIGDTPVRVLTVPIVASSQTFAVQVFDDRTAEVRTLGILVSILVVGGLGVLAAALLLGYVYAGRALVPVRESLRRQREFAADASHELRTPLAVIRGSVEHLRRHSGEPVGSVGTAVDDIDSEVTRLARLVDDLLLLARTDSGEVELAVGPVDLADVAADALESLAALAREKDLRMVLDVAPTPCEGDERRLRQLVGILVDNAIRHSPAGADVTVRVRPVAGGGELVVEDFGPGIPEEDLPRVFDRFWRAPGAEPGGTGLGLSIAAWIVERHGGRIVAASRAEGGARFTAVFPESHAA